MRLTTDVELAEILGVSVEDVHLKCRRQWPCVKPKRGVWRFTDAHVQAIIDMSSVSSTPRRRPSTSGQTQRSAARAS